MLKFLLDLLTHKRGKIMMYDAKTLSNLTMKKRIECAKKVKSLDCAWTDDGRIFIRTISGENNSFLEPYRHSHEDYEVMIPLTPIPCLIQCDEVCFGEVGYCYPITSNKSHGINCKLLDSKYIIIVVQKEWYESVTKNLCVPINHVSRFFYSNILKDLVEMFCSLFKQNFEFKQMELGTCADFILAEILRQIVMAQQTPIYKTKEYHKGIQKVVNYINQNYTKEISIDDLAEISGLSKFYFIRSFKKFTSVSPIDYIIKIRVSHAKFYLSTTDYKIKDIATLVGFNSSSALIRAFKKQMLLTPTEYIEQCKHIDPKQSKK